MVGIRLELMGRLPLFRRLFRAFLVRPLWTYVLICVVLDFLELTPALDWKRLVPFLCFAIAIWYLADFTIYLTAGRRIGDYLLNGSYRFVG